MSRNLVRPFFPNAPTEYNQQYQEEIVRAFAVLLAQIQNPGDAQHTNLTLTTLQSDNDSGLATGALFEVDGFLKVSSLNRPHVVGVETSTAVGIAEVQIL
jgi:hypothetical protein